MFMVFGLLFFVYPLQDMFGLYKLIQYSRNHKLKTKNEERLSLPLVLIAGS